MMRLRVVLPTEIFHEADAVKIVAEGPQGSFCLKPRHIDTVSPLVPGILSWLDTEGREHFAAVAGGLLVKKSREVLVAVRAAVRGDLGELRAEVLRMAEETREQVEAAHSAASRLEVGLVRRFLEFGK